MHMTDALLSPAVGAAMCCASAGCVGYAARRLRLDGSGDKKMPILAVMGAFVFAAQMVNFAIPGTGSSGHIGGGVLLAGLVGGPPALLSISVVLVIQALFFADGGLLALGCNIFNIGVVPALLCYPLVFAPIIKGGATPRRIAMASMAASIAALQLGALGVVAQTHLSGISGLPFGAFALLMQPIHLAIGIVEGMVTAAILCFVHKMRPEIISGTSNGVLKNGGISMRNVITAAAALTIIVGGLLSHFASTKPDGLEWSIEKAAEGGRAAAHAAPQHMQMRPLIEGAAAVQEKTALMPGYDFKGARGLAETGSALGPSAAGMLGAALTFLLAAASAFAIARAKRKKEK
jgi:cobalt/nickel transport system permease protein